MHMKGQAGASDLAKVIVTVAVSLIIGVYVFATISPSIDNTVVTNETVGTFAASVASYLVDNTPIAAGTYTVNNCTLNGTVLNALTETTHYVLNKDSGKIANASTLWNGTATYMFIDYSYGQLTEAAAQSSFSNIGTNSYNAFTLGAIVIIVIAAAAILRNLGIL